MLERVVQLDWWLRFWVVTHRVSWLTPLMWVLSIVGRGGIVWLAAGAGLALARKIALRGFLQLTLAILLASWVTNQFVKPLVGYSRVYLGVHYPFDVVGGAVVGLLLGVLVRRSFRA